MYTDISKQWAQECEHIKSLSTKLQIVDLGVQIMQRPLESEFKVIQYMTQTQQHVKKIYKQPEQFIYNRHQGIMTFEENRVHLGDIQTQDHPKNYINANYITLFNHKTIATQGPKQNTLLNFWRMVWQQEVSSIFMLCERTQNGRQKCFMYWPPKQQSLAVEDFQIRIMEVQNISNIRIRHILIKNTVDKIQKKVKQYQFLGWPDGKEPLPHQKQTLNKLAKIYIQQLEGDRMSVVHCSAGVGRTGTFIAIAEIKMTILRQHKHISIFELVRKLRQQRWGMVYTNSQYEYLYKFAQETVNQHYQSINMNTVQKCNQANDKETV